MITIYKTVLFSLLFLHLVGQDVFSQRIFPAFFAKLPRDMQLYARDDNNFAEVPIQGKVELTGWHHISVIVFRNNIRVGYQKTVLNYGANSFAAFDMRPKIKAEMADYSFEVYICRLTDSSSIVRRNEVVAGDFFVINGQSNASALKYGDWSSKYCRTVARIPDSSPAIGLGDTLWIQSAWSWPFVGAWGLQLQRSILENHGIPTCVINGSLPGSKIATHVDRNPQNPATSNLYGLLLTRVRAANPTRIRAFFWYQGEQEVLENIGGYPEQYTKLYNFWQTDYPQVEKFVVLQIPVLFNPYYIAGTIRDFQRRTKFLYAKSEHFSTMGLPYFDGIHYDIKGYQELGKRLYNFLGPGIYRTAPVDNAECPDIKKVFYSSAAKNEITLVFNEGQKLKWPNDTLIEDVNYNFFLKSLRQVFYLDGDEDESKPIVVKSGSADGNRVKLVLFASSAAKKLNYLPAYKGHYVRIYYGPFLTNSRGLGAFSFQNVDINDALVLSNFKAVENNSGAIDLTWNAVAGASYMLYRKAEGEAAFIKIQDLAANKLSFIDKNVARNKTYAYRIQAVNSLSESAFNDISIKTAAALPVTLVEFAAVRDNENKVKLNWSTTTELDNFQFEIHRSTNPVSGFETIGAIDGSGNSSIINRYEFDDKNALPQLTYYRLKQIDFDGTFNYSRIIALQPFKINFAVKAYPNPAIHQQLQFRIYGLNSPEMISFVIYDEKGIKLYKDEKYQLTNQFLISIRELKNKKTGHLFIKVLTSEHSATSAFIVY